MLSIFSQLSETITVVSLSAPPTVVHIQCWAVISHITLQTMLGKILVQVSCTCLPNKRKWCAHERSVSSRFAESHFAESCFAESHIAESRFAKCCVSFSFHHFQFKFLSLMWYNLFMGVNEMRVKNITVTVSVTVSVTVRVNLVWRHRHFTF